MNRSAYITPFQSKVLIGALLYADEGPQSPYKLSGGHTVGKRDRQLQELLDIGLLAPHPAGTRTRYSITEKGRPFAEALVEIEELREAA